MRFGRSVLIPGLLLVSAAAGAADKPRARALGVPFDGTPGLLDAITDVAGVTVGHVTLIEGEGKLVVGKGPVRTGVTAILPRGRASLDDPVFAGWFALNGAGEMTGTTWLEESGFLAGPVMITNTHSVGAVHEGTIAWRVAQGPPDATRSRCRPGIRCTPCRCRRRRCPPRPDLLSRTRGHRRHGTV